MTSETLRYPIDIQSFPKLRKGGYVYVDKTGLIYDMVNSGVTYMFLSRPRRFGKSLLTSTLHSYFAGQKELFKGLAIERLEKDWTPYPVLHFDMSGGKHLTAEALEQYLLDQLAVFENTYGIESDSPYTNLRLKHLIRTAFEKTGRPVVLLIDEYDAPLLDVVHQDDTLRQMRDIMRNFYSPLKSCDDWLRCVFLTGITKFSQLSIFSEFNNIKNISMMPRYASLCGITESEMHEFLMPGISRLAAQKGYTTAQTLAALKALYDGYHFCWPSPDIYNPYRLLNALNDGSLDSYWFDTGTPTYLIEMLRKMNVVPSEIAPRQVRASAFNAPAEKLASVTPLLYQSGCLTIQGYEEPGMYTLGFPNKEVRIGLMECLLPNYISEADVERSQSVIYKIYKHLNSNDVAEALRCLQAYLLTVPYAENASSEGHFQQLLYVIFSLLGYYVDVEVRTPRGRVDLVARTSTHLYLFELKLNKDAQTAMNQINVKDYASRFALSGLPVVKVAVNFDAQQRTITDWLIA